MNAFEGAGAPEMSNPQGGGADSGMPDFSSASDQIFSGALARISGGDQGQPSGNAAPQGGPNGAGAPQQIPQQPTQGPHHPSPQAGERGDAQQTQGQPEQGGQQQGFDPKKANELLKSLGLPEVENFDPNQFAQQQGGPPAAVHYGDDEVGSFARQLVSKMSPDKLSIKELARQWAQAERAIQERVAQELNIEEMKRELIPTFDEKRVLEAERQAVAQQHPDWDKAAIDREARRNVLEIREEFNSHWSQRSKAIDDRIKSLKGKHEQYAQEAKEREAARARELTAKVGEKNRGLRRYAYVASREGNLGVDEAINKGRNIFEEEIAEYMANTADVGQVLGNQIIQAVVNNPKMLALAVAHATARTNGGAVSPSAVANNGNGYPQTGARGNQPPQSKPNQQPQHHFAPGAVPEWGLKRQGPLPNLANEVDQLLEKRFGQ